MAEILHKDLLGDDIHELRITIGSSAPVAVPLFVGQGYYDIIAKKFYVAQGTSLVTDWVTTSIPPFLIFADTRTVTWTSNQVGNEVTYQANVDEAELVLTSSNITNFSTAVLTLPEVISLINDQHTRLIMRTGAEPGGWSPVVQGGLELDPSAQKIRLSQNLSEFGNPTFNEVTLYVKSKTPLLTLTTGGTPTAASMFLDASKGMVVRGYAGSTSSFTLQNESGTDVLKNPVGSSNLVVPSLAAGAGAPGVVHADSVGLLSTSKLVNADVDVAAAIAGTKISPDFGSQTVQTTGNLLVNTINSNINNLSVLPGTENKSLNLATGTGYNTINIGGLNSIVNITGGVFLTPVEYVSSDKAMILNFGASGLSGQNSGIEVQEEHTETISLTRAQWQSGNTVRLYTSDTSDIVVNDYLRVSGFTKSSNNGTFKVVNISTNTYLDILNQNRTNATDDEINPATGAHLVINGYALTGPTRESWDFKAPARTGIISLKKSNSYNMVLTSTGTTDVTVDFKTNLTIDQDLQKSASVEFGGLKVSSLSTGLVHSSSTGVFSSSLLVDADVSGTAAIAGTKISPDFGSQNVTTTGTASFASVNVTNGEAPGGSVLSKSATYGVQVRGITGTNAEFRFLSQTGTPIADFASSGQVTLYNLLTTGVVKSTAGVLSSALLVNADVSATAAIAGTKISPDFGSQNVTTTGSVTGNSLKASGLGVGVIHSDASGNFTSSTVVNADVSATAAIAGTKISPNFGNQNIVTTGSVSAASATITGLNSAGVVHTDTSGNLSTSTIVNADVSATAAIDGSKISPNFGSQTVQTTGAVQSGSLTVNGLTTLSGGQKVKLSSLITSNYVASATDYILQVDTTGGAISITMPSAASVGSGAVIIIKDASGAAVTNNITVLPNGSDLIDGDGYFITDTYASITFVSDGVSKWLVI